MRNVWNEIERRVKVLEEKFCINADTEDTAAYFAGAGLLNLSLAELEKLQPTATEIAEANDGVKEVARVAAEVAEWLEDDDSLGIGNELNT